MVHRIDVEKDKVDNFKRGLDLLREKYKTAKYLNDYDAMADSVENIKSEIKNKLLSKGKKDIVQRVEKICDWYRNKEEYYSVRTPSGIAIVFPPDMNKRVNKNLTVAYELLVQEMDKLGLL